MTVIGVDHAAGDLRLHSCPACGRHAWRNGEREVDRSELLAALRSGRRAAAADRGAGASRPARAAGSGVSSGRAGRASVPAVADAGDAATRRAELQQLLSTFTVHGTTS